MIAQMPTAIAFRERIAKGLPVIPPRDDLDHAANFLNMVNGKVPSPAMREAFDVSMVLYTEHELNASTFAARVTVSRVFRHLFRDRRGDRHAQGAAPRGRQRRGVEGARASRHARKRRKVDPASPGPKRTDHGLRAPRLQDRRSPGHDSQAVLQRGGQRGGRSSLGAGRRADRKGCNRPEEASSERRLARARACITTWGWTSICTRRSLPWPGRRAGPRT